MPENNALKRLAIETRYLKKPDGTPIEKSFHCLDKGAVDALGAGMHQKICDALVGIEINYAEKRISYHPLFTSQVVAALVEDYADQIKQNNYFGFSNITELQNYLIRIVAHSNHKAVQGEFQKLFQAQLQNEKIIEFLTQIKDNLARTDESDIACNAVMNLIARLESLKAFQ